MLDKKKKYLQVALNSTLNDAERIIRSLPASDRIIMEAGTPLIKKFGYGAISKIKTLWSVNNAFSKVEPYVVADLKTMDRGETEAKIAWEAGAGGAIALGLAPLETLNIFVEECAKLKIDSMIDMMNVDQPIKILRKLKKIPNVVILHRGVDEETFNKLKPIPYLQINKIRATTDTMIAIAGGDTIREVQRAVFNDADIVVVWKDFYRASSSTGTLATEFLKEIK